MNSFVEFFRYNTGIYPEFQELQDYILTEYQDLLYDDHCVLVPEYLTNEMVNERMIRELSEKDIINTDCIFLICQNKNISCNFIVEYSKFIDENDRYILVNNPNSEQYLLDNYSSKDINDFLNKNTRLRHTNANFSEKFYIKLYTELGKLDIIPFSNPRLSPNFYKRFVFPLINEYTSKSLTKSKIDNEEEFWNDFSREINNEEEFVLENIDNLSIDILCNPNATDNIIISWLDKNGWENNYEKICYFSDKRGMKLINLLFDKINYWDDPENYVRYLNRVFHCPNLSFDFIKKSINILRKLPGSGFEPDKLGQYRTAIRPDGYIFYNFDLDRLRELGLPDKILIKYFCNMLPSDFIIKHLENKDIRRNYPEYLRNPSIELIKCYPYPEELIERCSFFLDPVIATRNFKQLPRINKDELKREVKIMKNRIKYKIGGTGYLETKQHFNKITKTI